MKSMEQIYEAIEREIEFIDTKPFSHNIISMNLQIAAKQFGIAQANRLIDEFGLAEFGWHKVKEKGKGGK